MGYVSLPEGMTVAEGGCTTDFQGMTLIHPDMS